MLQEVVSRIYKGGEKEKQNHFMLDFKFQGASNCDYNVMANFCKGVR